MGGHWLKSGLGECRPDAAVMRRRKRETHARRLFDDSGLAIAGSNDDLMHTTGWKTYDMFSVYT
jgi:hypothetical protein